MSDSFIQVPPDAGGKKVDATEVVVGANTVERQHIRPAGDAATDIGNVTASEGVSASLSVTSANRTHATSASLAAGGEVDLDAAQITSSLTGKLIQIIITSSVPFRAQLKTVTNGVESGALVTWIDRHVDCTFAHKKFLTVAHDGGAGLDTFRVSIKNLDTSEAADVYATFFYDEE
jgi:hypothetical protein